MFLYINYGTTRAVLESVQLHLLQHFSLHKNKLLVPQGNQLLHHSWKMPSTLLLWRLHTLVNVLVLARGQGFVAVNQSKSGSTARRQGWFTLP